MSAPAAPQQQPVRIGPAPDPRRPVTLPTWVNVVLVLILLVSCGAANNTSPPPPSSSEVADQVVQQLQNGDGSGAVPASGSDVQDLCRLLGAVLDGQKQKVDAVIGADASTQCAEAARQGAAH